MACFAPERGRNTGSHEEGSAANKRINGTDVQVYTVPDNPPTLPLQLRKFNELCLKGAGAVGGMKNVLKKKDTQRAFLFAFRYHC